MARRSRMSILKRQRELKKSEKAARKRARRHGVPEPLFQEPTATFDAGGMLTGDDGEGQDDGPAEAEAAPETEAEETDKD